MSATARLKAAGRAALAQNARRDARLLMTIATGIASDRLAAYPERGLGSEEIERFESFVARRLSGESPGRIADEREFWSLPFELGRETLEPRPDSETVVRAALDATCRFRAGWALDLGTGTGCLLLAFLSERPGWLGVGMDANDGAISVAVRNARRLGLARRANMVRGDWSAESASPAWARRRYDIVLANPPYIPSAQIGGLEPEVALGDPLVALDGGVDGMRAYRAIARILPSILREAATVCFEVGRGQADELAALLEASGLAVRERRRDLAGIERCVSATVDASRTAVAKKRWPPCDMRHSVRTLSRRRDLNGEG